MFLFTAVALLLLFGAGALGIDRATAAHEWLAAGGPWAPLAAVVAFAALAFLGVPQFVLIAAAVAAFGPWWGGALSWIATLASSLVGFAFGRAFGARALAELGSEAVDRFTQAIGRNGFWASLAVRLVPFAPFVVVNMAAGVAPMRLADFAAGTAIGIIPKIVLTALAGKALTQVFGSGGEMAALLLAAAALVWFATALAARRWAKR